MRCLYVIYVLYNLPEEHGYAVRFINKNYPEASFSTEVTSLDFKESVV